MAFSHSLSSRVRPRKREVIMSRIGQAECDSIVFTTGKEARRRGACVKKDDEENEVKKISKNILICNFFSASCTQEGPCKQPLIEPRQQTE